MADLITYHYTLDQWHVREDRSSVESYEGEHNTRRLRIFVKKFDPTCSYSIDLAFGLHKPNLPFVISHFGDEAYLDFNITNAMTKVGDIRFQLVGRWGGGEIIKSNICKFHIRDSINGGEGDIPVDQLGEWTEHLVGVIEKVGTETEALINRVSDETIKWMENANTEAIENVKQYSDEKDDEVREYVDTQDLEFSKINKQYTDSGDESALRAAKNYADEGDLVTLNAAKNHAELQDEDVLRDSKAYTDEKAESVLQDAKAYSDSKISSGVDSVKTLLNEGLAGKADKGSSYTKQESDSKYLTTHQSLDHLVPKDWWELKADATDVYNRTETDSKLAAKADKSSVYTKTESDGRYLQEHQDISGKADKGESYTKAESDALYDEKLDKPSGTPNVGDLMRIKQVNDDGTYTFELVSSKEVGGVKDVQVAGNSVIDENGVANVLAATNSTPGVIKVYNGNTMYGLGITDGGIFTNKATNPEIDSRMSAYKPIVPSNLPYAVKSAMSAPITPTDPEWVETEKEYALARLGIDPAMYEYLKAYGTKTVTASGASPMTLSYVASAMADMAINGKSFKWNQLINPSTIRIGTFSGITSERDDDGIVTLNGVARSKTDIMLYDYQNGTLLVNDNSYLVSFGKNLPQNINGSFGGNYSFTNKKVIRKVSDLPIGHLRIDIQAGDVFDNVTIRPTIVNLTAIFGSENEPTSVTDPRIVWVENYFESHPGYSAGEIFDVTTPTVTITDGINTQTQTFPYTLRSVGDVHDELVVNEDGTGSLIQRIGVVKLETIKFSNKKDVNNVFYSWDISGLVKTVHGAAKSNILTEPYTTYTKNEVYEKYSVDMGICLSPEGYIGIRDTSVNTVDELKTKLTGKTLYYEHITPIETAITAEQMRLYKPTSIVSNDKDSDMSVTYEASPVAVVRADSDEQDAFFNSVGLTTRAEREEFLSSFLAKSDIFWCEYGVTTYQEVSDAIRRRKIPAIVYDGRTFLYITTESSGAHLFGVYHSTMFVYIRCSQSNSWSANYVQFIASTVSEKREAVKTGLTNGGDWTAEQQLAARQLIGLEKEWTLVGTIHCDENDRGNVDTMLRVDLTGYTELLVKAKVTATGTSSFTNGAFVMASDVGYNGNRMSELQFVDGFDGYRPVRARYVNATSSFTNLYYSGNLNTYEPNNRIFISNIRQLYLENPSRITFCDVQIYAR